MELKEYAARPTNDSRLERWRPQRAIRSLPWIALLSVAVYGCESGEAPEARSASLDSDLTSDTQLVPPGLQVNGKCVGVRLPAPYSTPSADKKAQVVGWPAGKTPTATAGLRVTSYAEGLAFPRWLYPLPNGDVLVSEGRSDWSGPGHSPDIVELLRDTDKDGFAETRVTFAEKLNLPFGMLLLGDWIYIANTDAIYRYHYTTGQTHVDAPERVIALPSEGYHGHWTRNLIASPDGKKIFVTVGSATNVAEEGMAKEEHRANILEMNPDGSGLRVYASGLRNPVGVGFNPVTGQLWTAVNERDELGDDLVPDYTTSVREGAFYGWPFAYIGQNEDPRRAGERPDLVKKTICPDIVLGAHTASLGLHFYRGSMFPRRYRHGLFISQHGSWNRSTGSGYKVIYIPFKFGIPVGPPEDFVTGFLVDPSVPSAYGRPVGLTELADGSMLVADDDGKRVWRISN